MGQPAIYRQRRLLGELARCAWKTLQEYTKAQVADPAAVPGAVITIQTYGDQLNWHPHLHSLVSDVAWNPTGDCLSLGRPDVQALARLFRHHVLEMLRVELRLSREFAAKLRNWARLLKKIYQVDPLTCPRSGSEMEIIAFIEEWAVIRKILRHLNLWERPPRSPPPPRLLPHKLEALPAPLSPRQAQKVRASTDSVFWDDLPVYNG